MPSGSTKSRKRSWASGRVRPRRPRAAILRIANALDVGTSKSPNEWSSFMLAKISAASRSRNSCADSSFSSAQASAQSTKYGLAKCSPLLALETRCS